MAGTTTNLALRYPSSTDPDNVPGDISNLATDVDTVLSRQGLLSARPAAGKKGQLYYATDTDQVSRDDGTAWHDFPSRAVTDAAYVAQTLVDAKGDLLVGSADNVVVRKAVGTDGQVFVADSTAPGGVKWGAGVVGVNPLALGYVLPQNVGSNATYPGASQAFFHKIRPAATVTVTAINFNITAAPSGNMDVGIYADSAGSPSSRLVSTGSFAVPAAGLIAKAITSTVLTAGVTYWLAIVCDNSTANFALGNSTVTGAAQTDFVQQQSVFPLPATAGASAVSTSKQPLLYINA